MKKLLLLLFIANIYSATYAGTDGNFYITPKIAILTIKNPVEVYNVTRKLIDFTTDKNIAGVILVVDSCGGHSSEFSVLHDHIKVLSAKKPTVCLVVIALSAGYLVASAAHYIIVHSGSSIGSIGVCIKQLRDKNMLYEFLGSGTYKGSNFLPLSQLSDKDRAYLQDLLDRDYQLFIQQVAANRTNHLSLDNQKDWAEAQTFIGSEAVDVGLVDEVGTFFTAERKIKELLCKKYPGLAFTSVDYVTY